MKKNIFNRMMKKFFFILLLFFVSNVSAQIDQANNYKWELAQNYELAGQIDKAAPLYKELFQSQPLNYSFFEALNKIYIAQKKYNESLQLIESKIKMTPADPGLYGTLGTTYFLMDNSTKAYEAWAQGIATSPKSSTTYRIIANSAIENRAYDKAIQILLDGKKKSTDAFIFSVDLSNIYAANMNFGKAATELCELMLSHPEQAGLVRTRIGSFITRPLAASQTTEAIKYFCDEHPTIDLLDLLAFTYQQSGKNLEAFETVKSIEKDFNGNGRYVYVLAQSLLDQKQFDISAKAFNYILEHYPKSDYATIAGINYARALEELLNQQSDSITTTWKPITSRQKINTDQYKKIIEAYSSFISSRENSPYTSEALFRIGEIYHNRLLDLVKADSIFSIIKKDYSQTNQSLLATLSSGKIAIENNALESARDFFGKIISNPRSDPAIISEAQFNLARIEFWKGNFSVASQKLKELNRTLSNDYSNDALELNFLINIAKRDSINLLKYANADLLLLQNKVQQAATEFKTLADNDNLFIINQFAKQKLAEIFLLEEDFFSGTKLLETLSNDDKGLIFVDKSTFLLGLTYLYGSKDIPKAKETFEKILEKFPNSIYFDRARDELNRIQNKNG